MGDRAGMPSVAIDRDALIGPVRTLLRDETAEISDWRHESLPYTVRNPIAGGVFRVSGHAHLRGALLPWSLILKVSHSPAGRSWPDSRIAPPGWGTDPTHSQYWKREALAYRSGILDDLTGGLVAPRCFGVDEPVEGTIWLWLEDIHETEPQLWPMTRYGAVARHLGQFNGAYLANRPIPSLPWLNRGFLRSWTIDPARVALVEMIVGEDIWAHPIMRQTFPIPVAARLRRLHTGRDALLAMLEQLPQTLSHLDAFSGNLLVRDDATGGAQTVAIDWAFVGIAAVGEEIGHLIAWSLLLGAVDVTDAEALRAVVLDGYCAGLRDAGWPGDTVQVADVVGRGASIAAALRWAFTAAHHVVRLVGDEGDYAAAGRAGAPITDAIRRQASLVSFLLDWVEESTRAV